MSMNELANQDFERAVLRAFWRKIITRLTGEKNDLLPFDEVRARLPIRGQHYIGLRQVPVSKIIGSMGRYQDFDRAFLPIQIRTKDRWVSIDKAHYAQVILPPVDLYKIGDIYFVKDGNHRVFEIVLTVVGFIVQIQGDLFGMIPQPPSGSSLTRPVMPQT